MVVELTGKLHPLMVHLPIGVILLFILLEFYQLKSKIEIPKIIMRIIILFGVFSGIASLISGYALSLNGSNDGDSLENHKWIAIATITWFTIYGYVIYFNSLKNRTKIISLSILLILLIVTGHLGGKLTHGENYWDFISRGNKKNELITQRIYNVKNVDDAKVFDDLIMYSFQQKCIQCHGLDRQKGKLRLDGKEWILKGGEDGSIINISNPNNSEIIKRIFLDLDEEQHMPPKSKQQLSEEEKNIIEWWVTSGASFDKKVSEIQKTSSIDSILKIYHKKLISLNPSRKEEREKINPISNETMKSLIRSGWVVSPISKKDNHLRVIGFNIEKSMDSCLDQLVNIKENIIELKLSFKRIDKNNLVKISKLTNLEKLWLDNCSIADNSIQSLSNLKNLAYLNLSNNKLSFAEIQTLSNLKKLEKLYIQHTGIQNAEYSKLAIYFPSVKIFALEDTMNKVVSDTLFIKKIR
jgi:uncharacterized membrane protein